MIHLAWSEARLDSRVCNELNCLQFSVYTNELSKITVEKKIQWSIKEGMESHPPTQLFQVYLHWYLLSGASLNSGFL
jgi:hypothetical protein